MRSMNILSEAAGIADNILPYSIVIFYAISMVKGVPRVTNSTFELINKASAARFKWVITDINGTDLNDTDFKIGIYRTYIRYEELVSWEDNLSQKYQNRGDVSIAVGVSNATSKYITITINRLTQDDSSLYRCRLFHRESMAADYIDMHTWSEDYGYANFYPNVTQISQNYPLCSFDQMNDTLIADTLIAGTEIQMTCSHLGKPPVQLQWHIKRNERRESIGDPVEDPAGRRDVVLISYSQLRVTLQENHTGAIFMCTVSSSDIINEGVCFIGPFNVTSYMCSNVTSGSKNEHSHTVYQALVATAGAIALVSFIVNIVLCRPCAAKKKEVGVDLGTRGLDNSGARYEDIVRNPMEETTATSGYVVTRVGSTSGLVDNEESPPRLPPIDEGIYDSPTQTIPTVMDRISMLDDSRNNNESLQEEARWVRIDTMTT